MRVFFDVDFTWLGQDGTMRPGTRELMEELIADGHEIHIWSGFGKRTEEIVKHGLDDLVSGVHTKPLTGMADGYEAWGLPYPPDFVIDDHPGPVAFMGGHNCSAYIDRTQVGDPHEWDQVRAAIAVHVAADRARQAGSTRA